MQASLTRAMTGGQTQLHYPHGGLRHGAEIIDLLVTHGADVNAQDDSGQGGLSKVVSSGATDLAVYLRSLGALGNT